ncbi:uncharacterized protein LOC118823034 isoform X2 [Colossoma macropomum]|uniref:uncharacterized protein LOC118823034 isoform X2 n=1 Tax=Colossoma macropomum TaxID=42526 RepID=UPI0018651FB6|nr:uncharacterized protein LOC118823034 isoform X2 [Colossoma macropomum]
MKVTAPALSRQAFVRRLEHRSHQSGRAGAICGDTFQKSFLELQYCMFEEQKLCQVEHFVCPACTPHMLAVSVDGNRKHYRFKKSKRTDEPSMFEGIFLARDDDVSSFVNLIRSHLKGRPGEGVCGTSTFTAGRETSSKSSAKLDEEGLEIAVCRHGCLLRGLNHYRGEIFTYPMYLQNEVAQISNVSFFCMDVTCRYWPYLKKVAENLPEFKGLTEMKPFLSVMHAKAHNGKCEVRWGGRSQEGAGNTIGEEVEQVNSFLSRGALTTKYMTKSVRADMITLQSIAWNKRKEENLHKALAQRFSKAVQRAAEEAASLKALREQLNLSLETPNQWVSDVRQWASTAVLQHQRASRTCRVKLMM